MLRSKKEKMMKEENDDVPKRMMEFLSVKPYVAPSWASHLNHIPTHFSSLGHREDLCGMQLSGNKARKLEFFIADALQQGADCIITAGNIQSNHCRATAVAAKYFNLDSYLILFTSKALVNQDPGLNGNLLVERLVGAHLQLASKEDLAKMGSTLAFTDYLKSKLLAEGRKPYVIPVGGSNSLGNWGYIEAIREIEQQLDDKIKFDDIVVACGSGGTLVGLSLGSWLSTVKAKVHAFSIFEHSDNYFYDLMQCSLDRLAVSIDSHEIVEVHKAKGLGYAMNTSAELHFIREVAESTGIVLDPVYTGKAAYGMMKEMRENPKKWEGRNILFIHTGGLLGLYDKVDEMESIMLEKWGRLNVDEIVASINEVAKMF